MQRSTKLPFDEVVALEAEAREVKEQGKMSIQWNERTDARCTHIRELRQLICADVVPTGLGKNARLIRISDAAFSGGYFTAAAPFSPCYLGGPVLGH